MRKLIIPLVALAAVAAATPRILKRAFAPPVRAVHGEPDDYDLAGTDVWIDGPNGKRLHGWWIPVDRPAPAAWPANPKQPSLLSVYRAVHAKLLGGARPTTLPGDPTESGWIYRPSLDGSKR